MKNISLNIIFFALGILYCAIALGQHHPVLFSTQDMSGLKEKIDQYPLLQKSYAEARTIAEEGLVHNIDVPIPADEAGGYTHNRHKRNYEIMYNAGKLFAITGDKKYAVAVKNILLKYATIIPLLKNHPKAKGSSPGRLFHQALNDCNWIVYSIQGYDAIYATLTPHEKTSIEEKIFLPLCKYITSDLKSWFNLIHNHGVWACAAVGMSGLVMNNNELVQQSLYGSDGKGLSGFLVQLSHLFSPDGYYVEGPYYARYALLPFYTYASALQTAKPELKIFSYRNNLLQKALETTLQQTAVNGAFFPINDAVKDKTWLTSELVFAISEATKHYGKNEGWLFVAKQHNKAELSQGGLLVASALKNGKSQAYFPYRSLSLRDGAKGNEGGLSILRTGEKQSLATLVFKYTSHGLSHGHYDRLNLLLYGNGAEILQDYGAARFLNVAQKDGGRYLEENTSYAVQTIAHNTIVADEKSHYNGNEKEAAQHHPHLYFSQLNNDVQVVSAIDSNAYDGVVLHRTLFMLKDDSDQPIIIDLFRARRKLY